MRERAYAFLAMAFLVSLSNYLVLFPLNNHLTWGAFTYPVTFLVTELSNRFWGARRAREVVYIGFFLAAILSWWLATPRIAMASAFSFLISQLFDISLFSRLRQLTWWQAPLIASVVASGLDTILFFTFAFVGEPLPWLSWALGDFVVKVTVDLLMLMPFRVIIASRARLAA